MKEVRVQLTANVFAKNPKAIKMKKIKTSYDALLNFASSSFKFNKKKTKMFVRKFGGNTSPGTEITKDSDVENILINDIMIAVSKGEDYIGSSYKLNEKELSRYPKAPYQYLIKDISFEKKEELKPEFHNKNPKHFYTNEECKMMMKTFPILDGNVYKSIKEVVNGMEEIDIYYSQARYYSFDYNTKIKYPIVTNWKTGVLRELRGLIVSSVTGKILARRFHKFFNLDETPETQLSDLNLKDAKMYHKLDGSLVSPIKLDTGQIIWATRKVPIVIAPECLTPDLIKFVEGCVTKNLTPLFEYCQKDKYVGIIEHSQNDLTLLAVRHNITGEYMNLESLVTLKISVVSQCNVRLDAVDKWVNKEGIVLVMPNGHRYKLKSKWYKCVAQSNYYGSNIGFIEQYIKRYGSIDNCPKDNLWKHVLNVKIANKKESIQKSMNILSSKDYQSINNFIKQVQTQINILSISLSKWYDTISNTVDDSSSIKTIVESNGWPSLIFDKEGNINRRELENYLFNIIKNKNVDVVESILDIVWDSNQMEKGVIKTNIIFPIKDDIKYTSNIKKHLVDTYLPAKILQLTRDTNIINDMTLTIPHGYKSDEGRINGLWEEFKKNNIWDLRIDLQPSTNGIYNEHYGNKDYALLLVQYGLENSKRVPSGSLAGILVPVDTDYKLEEYQIAMKKALEYNGVVKMRRKVVSDSSVKKIYCDLDGVLADFVKGVIDLTKMKPEDQSQRKMWQRILAKEHFFETLDWMPQGQTLWSHIQSISKQKPTILTGLPSNGQNKVVKSKKKWCKDKLGEDIEVITCMSKAKHEYSAKGHILIDDRSALKANWVKQGGIFIHHYNIDKTVHELKKIFNKLPTKINKPLNNNPNIYKMTRNVICHETLIDNKMYKYTSGITYANLNDFCDKKIMFKKQPKIVAVDFEWNPYKSCRSVSIAQLSTKDTVYIFDMSIGKQMEYVNRILKDVNIIKLGFGLDDDVRRLNNDIINVIDIQNYIVINYESVWGTKIPSLDISGQLIINSTIQKDKVITMSQWDLRPLSNEQVDYAAKDASVLYDIYTTILHDNNIEGNIRDIIGSNLYIKESDNVVFNFEYDLNKPMRVIYSGIFLSSESTKEIQKRFPAYHSNVKYDHITLSYEPTGREVKKLNIGQYINIKVIGYYQDEKIDALLVETNFGIGHITMSVANGVSPKEAKDILQDKYQILDNVINLTGIIGLYVTYINDELAGLPERIKEKIKQFESDSQPGETLKFKPHELTSTHRSIIHKYAELHYMSSQSSGKDINRKMILTMGRQKKQDNDIKILSRKSDKFQDITFRLMDIKLVNKANLIFPVEKYIAQLEFNQVKWNKTLDLTNTLIIMRGLSGSGKSTLAKIIKEDDVDNIVIVSSDKFFIKDDEYKFDINKLEEAHQFCYRSCEMCLSNGVKTVIVDNTNSTLNEYKKYKDLAKENDYKVLLLEIECTGKTDAIIMGKRNSHHKNIKATLKMYNRWQIDEDVLYIKPFWTDKVLPNNQSEVSLMKWLVDNKFITSIKSNKKTHMSMSIGGLGVKFINIPNERMDEFYQIYYDSGITGNYSDEHKYIAELLEDKFRLYFDIDYEDEVPFEDIDELARVVEKVTGTQDVYITGNPNVNNDIVKTGMHIHCYDIIVTLEECLEYRDKLIKELGNDPILNHIQWVKFIDDQAYNCIRMLGSRKVTRDVDKGNVYSVMYKSQDVDGIELLKKVSCRV